MGTLPSESSFRHPESCPSLYLFCKLANKLYLTSTSALAARGSKEAGYLAECNAVLRNMWVLHYNCCDGLLCWGPVQDKAGEQQPGKSRPGWGRQGLQDVQTESAFQALHLTEVNRLSSQLLFCICFETLISKDSLY